MREEAIAAVVDALCARRLPHPTRVAVDGITAAGKSTLAAELTAAVAARGRPAVHLSMDDFHHPRARRQRQGRLSARGYYEDAFDVAGLLDAVLLPLGPDGDRRCRPRIHDLHSDAAVVEPPLEVAPDAVVVVDGTFLQRPRLRSHWDVVVYVDTSFDVALERAVGRDAELFGGAAATRAAYVQRYHAACRTYLDEVHPQRCADIVWDNDAVEAPVVAFSGPH